MDIFFNDPDEIPLPPKEVRIRKLTAEPWPSGKLIHVYMEVDPFQKRPNADLYIRNESGEIAAATSIIESMHRKMELTMHLPDANPGEGYTLDVKLYFAEIIEGNTSNQETKPIKKQVVDQSKIHFRIPIEDD
jgi:hypothetical protein